MPKVPNDSLRQQGSASLFLIVADLRAQERQAAEELGQWKTHREERKVIDASQSAITLAMLRNGEELDSMEKRAGDGEIAGRRRAGGSNVASPQLAVRHREPIPANAAARLDSVICWSRSLRGKRFGRRLTDRSR